MKVCLFLDNLDKKGGGPARSVPVLAKGLAENGVEVTLMVCESDDMNTHALDGTKVKVEIVKRNISFGDLENLFISSSFDIIHLQCVWLPIYHKVARIARKHNIKYVVSPRGCLEPWCYNDPNLVSRLKKHVAMALYQRSDLNAASAIFATADMEADNLRHLGFKNAIPIIPNGLEIGSYKCRSISMRENCKKRVLYISRITPKKGVDVLIEAWSMTSKKFPDWECAVYGNGEENYINSLKDLVNKMGISNSLTINMPIFGEDKYKAYTESSLFVLPTHSENFGMVIAEALSCGLPVITTKGTPWGMLEETGTGWWIDLSINNLVDSMEKAMSKPLAELFEMGQKGSAMVRENFDHIEVAKKIKKSYRWILGEDACPPYIQLS